MFLEMQLSLHSAAQRSAYLILSERALNDQSAAHPHSRLPSVEKGTDLAWEEEAVTEAGELKTEMFK